MADSNVNAVQFDVFLSHNGQDKPAVRALAALLKERAIKVWLDADELPPGENWQPLLEAGIKSSKTFAALIGPAGPGPWADEEMQAALNLAVSEQKKVIPVILPGAPEKPELSMFLRNRTWADIRSGLTEANIDKLLWGITGQKPNPRPPLPANVEVSAPRLKHGAAELFGREPELARLDAAWADPKTHVVTIVAWGGVGKTSLVFEWMNRLDADGWRGAERVFDWTFYSQGTRETGAASADAFIRAALIFFGDVDMANSNTAAWDKGARLAQLVAERRALLVLDGLEPLQHPPGAQAGKLKDPALESLLKGLARHNPGLCLVTTRESVTNLAPFHATLAPEWHLERLSDETGAALLAKLGVRGTLDERHQLCRDVDGHALTLHLFGGYLVQAHHGDIRKRSLVKLDKADARVQGGHAFKVMAVYETWLAESGEDDQRQLAVLRLLGLFDRPADPGCLAALREAPPIPGLTEPLAHLSDADWNIVVSDLEAASLLKTSEYEPKRVQGFNEQAAIMRRFGLPLGEPEAFAPPQAFTVDGARVLDVHPLLREHFGKRLRESNPEAWREGHWRLYEHLKASVPHWPEGVDGLQPLYQAVAHGCQAGLHQEARADVYRDRILRGQEFYSSKKLGAFGADLSAVACFFEQPWKRVSSQLTEADQAWLLNQAAYRLRALGRLTEALEPMRVALELGIRQENWTNAAIRASNLSELELTLGDVPSAVYDAEQSVTYADHSGDAFQRMGNRARLADALHQASQRAIALDRFLEAEKMQAENQPEYPLLCSLQGFFYCDLLLAEAERAAWRALNKLNHLQPSAPPSAVARRDEDRKSYLARCHEVEQRAAQTLERAEQYLGPLDIALDHLTMGRTALYAALLDHSALPTPHSALDKVRQQLTAAADGLRASGNQDDIPRGLLTRAWLRFVDGDAAGARDDLNEAWEIAERGPMRLHMADIHLHRARLFHNKAALAAARKLIEQCGYHRRDEELADAEAAAKDWPDAAAGG